MDEEDGLMMGAGRATGGGDGTVRVVAQRVDSAELLVDNATTWVSIFRLSKYGNYYTPFVCKNKRF